MMGDVVKMRVVYLDDEPALVELFQDAFSSENIAVDVYTDPATAISAIKSNPPDLVFLDYRLPGTTGDIVADKIGRALPKVLITGDLTVTPKSNFIKIFYKPYMPSEMRKFLEEFMKTRVAS